MIPILLWPIDSAPPNISCLTRFMQIMLETMTGDIYTGSSPLGRPGHAASSKWAIIGISLTQQSWLGSVLTRSHTQIKWVTQPSECEYTLLSHLAWVTQLEDLSIVFIIADLANAQKKKKNHAGTSDMGPKTVKIKSKCLQSRWSLINSIQYPYLQKFKESPRLILTYRYSC